MTRRWAIALLIGLGAAAAAVVACLGFFVSVVLERPATPEVADLDPVLANFELDTLDGERLGPRQLRGDVVVVDVWATWCKPCVAQAAILEGLQEEYTGQRVSFLALNTGEDPETVREYVTKTPFNYPVLLDPEADVMTSADLFALPTVLVLDPEGAVSWISVGLAGASAVRAAIETALGSESG